MAGYSKKPLIDKLGIKKDFRVLFVNEPASFIQSLGKLPKGIQAEKKIAGEYDYIHYFAFSRKELESFFKVIRKHLKNDGMMWVSWPKGGSKIKTDLNENIVRDIGLTNKLVDVKVAAIDTTWSGLKFVVRLVDRKSSL